MRRRFTANKGFTKTFDLNNYLTIEAIEDNFTVSFLNDIEYGIDGKGWIKLKAGLETPPINSGHTLSFRGELTPSSSNGIGTFIISKRCNLKGNCMSMLFGDNAANNFSLSGKDYAFYKLFYDCSNIVNVSSNFLLATTLADCCYRNMFRYCTNLTTAPELPATTLAKYCYSDIFQGCTNLTTAPELPATTLADSCYAGMFHKCTSLTTIPKLPAKTLARYCYDGMFTDCTSLTTAPELPATKLEYGCYHYMFYGCKSLTIAPELPAITLVTYCYQSMFTGCTKLNYIKMLATDIPATSCLSGWVWGVASSGTFVKNPAMTSLPTGESGIPEGWTVVNDGEESGGNLITFTVDGTEYQAEKGMTWEEWVDSEYNVINASIYLASGIGYIAVPSGEEGSIRIILNSSGYSVTATSEIISNHNYIVGGGGGGN